MIQLGKKKPLTMTLSGTAKKVSLPIDMFLVGKEVWQTALKQAFEDVNEKEDKHAREDKAATAVLALKQQMAKWKEGFSFSGRLNSGLRKATIKGPLRPI